jgi:hypothetical protein
LGIILLRPAHLKNHRPSGHYRPNKNWQQDSRESPIPRDRSEAAGLSGTIPRDRHQASILENKRQEIHSDWVPGIQTTRDRELAQSAKARDKHVLGTRVSTPPQVELRKESRPKFLGITFSLEKSGIEPRISLGDW